MISVWLTPAGSSHGSKTFLRLAIVDSHQQERSNLSAVADGGGSTGKQRGAAFAVTAKSKGVLLNPLGLVSLHGVREHTFMAIPAATLDSPVTWGSAVVQAEGTPTRGLRIGELEAQYPQYCKALRILIRDGATLAKVKRTVCWQRLELLHTSLPRQYRDPEILFLHLRRELNLQGSAA
jgi:hypothetical protein